MAVELGQQNLGRRPEDGGKVVAHAEQAAVGRGKELLVAGVEADVVVLSKKAAIGGVEARDPGPPYRLPTTRTSELFRGAAARMLIPYDGVSKPLLQRVEPAWSMAMTQGSTSINVVSVAPPTMVTPLARVVRQLASSEPLVQETSRAKVWAWTTSASASSTARERVAARWPMPSLRRFMTSSRERAALGRRGRQGEDRSSSLPRAVFSGERTRIPFSRESDRVPLVSALLYGR
jgi:hypothetical protein